MLIIYAYLLDLIFGDPRWLPHPVRGIGLYISLLERWIRGSVKTQKGELYGGVILLVGTVLPVYGLVTILLWSVNLVSPTLHLIFSVFLASTTISSRGLYTESLNSLRHLSRGDLERARWALRALVGRDTEHLSEEGIYRAIIESVAENTSDGVVAPLFYLAIGGVPLAFLYKAVNTLDSMVGYKNKRYVNLGWASAKTDDILNYLPARITAFLMVIVSFILRFDWKGSFRILRRDGRKHPSPNAGLPEAAAAGALRVRLGGGSYYGGVYTPKPYIGEPIEPLGMEKVFDALKLMHLTSLIMVILAALFFEGYGY